MINTQGWLYIAQITSSIAVLIGFGALIYLIKVVSNLDEGSFRKIFSSLGFFLMTTLIGVLVMTIYHFSSNFGTEELTEQIEPLWYIFIFVSLLASIYGSYTASAFGEEMSRIGKIARKSLKKK